MQHDHSYSNHHKVIIIKCILKIKYLAYHIFFIIGRKQITISIVYAIKYENETLHNEEKRKMSEIFTFFQCIFISLYQSPFPSIVI